MLDSLPSVAGDAALEEVRTFFFDHGHELAEAACILGGGTAEARVISCGVRLENASAVDQRIRSDLAAFRRLLRLENVGAPECIETGLFAAIDPASSQVETMCLLTDRLDELLDAIEFPDDVTARRATASPFDGAILPRVGHDRGERGALHASAVTGQLGRHA